MHRSQRPLAEPLESRRLFSWTPIGLTPAQVSHAYGFDRVFFQQRGHTFAGNGAGQTIAIIDAYDDPNIVNDLKAFNLQFGLSFLDAFGQFALTKVTPEGQPRADAHWAAEESLDVEWAHAMAPRAHILLVEAKTDSLNDLMGAIDYARYTPNVVTISISWGNDEFPNEWWYDWHLTSHPGHWGGSGLHGGITFVAASGDRGAPAGWPAVSPNVLSVGGTSLYVDAWGNYWGEQAWADSGGGFGTFENTWTTAPTVAYDADPATGFAVYDSFQTGWAGPWMRVGGTSAGAPQWAALIAIADEGRGLLGHGSLDTHQTVNVLFHMPAWDFHDIVVGNNGGYFATPGYDLVTGLGTPFADRVIHDLMYA